MRMRPRSPDVGAAPSDINLAAFPELELVAVQDGESAAPLRRSVMADGDHLLLRGDAEAAAAFAAKMHLALREEAAAASGEETLFNRRSGLAEVVIPPRSNLIGETVFPGMVTESGDLVVLAIQRGGAQIAEAAADKSAASVVLQAGDTMLLQGTWKALDVRLNRPDVLVVSSPELVRRHQRARGFSPAHRSSADDRRHAHPHGADRRRDSRRQSR